MPGGPGLLPGRRWGRGLRRPRSLGWAGPCEVRCGAQGVVGSLGLGTGLPLDSAALPQCSITPPASTASSACPASTAPQTTRSTHPTPAAVSGGGPGGVAWVGAFQGVSRSRVCPGRGVLGPSRLWEAPALVPPPRLGRQTLPLRGAHKPWTWVPLTSRPRPGCDCESDFTDGTCEDLTGRCYCRPNFTGARCDACAEGFSGFPRCHREGAAWGWGQALRP